MVIEVLSPTPSANECTALKCRSDISNQQFYKCNNNSNSGCIFLGKQ